MFSLEDVTLNNNTKNKLEEMGLIPVNSEMIASSPDFTYISPVYLC